jgi:hypothetical protein
MKNKIWVYLIIVLAGVIILCYPEQDDSMVVELSEKHGPSRLDLLGIFILMIGYTPMIVRVIMRYNVIVSTLGKLKSVFLIVLSILCLILISVALSFSYEVLLWVFVSVGTVLQAILIYYAFREKI